VGLDSHWQSLCTSSGEGSKSGQKARQYWVFCFMHVRQSSNITIHYLLYTVLYIRTCICTGDARKYCTKGVERFKITFSMTCMTFILLWQLIKLEGPLQSGPVNFAGIYPPRTPLFLRPPAPAIYPLAFVICWRFTRKCTNWAQLIPMKSLSRLIITVKNNRVRTY